jgi:circadian clock protein KaiB
MDEIQESGIRATDGDPLFAFWLFVADGERNSQQARERLAQLCAQYLNRPYKIVIYDVLEDYTFALEHRVLVTPTLIRVSPLPRVMIVGNLRDTSIVLAAL